jgi:hypothetical protein
MGGRPGFRRVAGGCDVRPGEAVVIISRQGVPKGVGRCHFIGRDVRRPVEGDSPENRDAVLVFAAVGFSLGVDILGELARRTGMINGSDFVRRQGTLIETDFINLAVEK